ncbi:flagellar basal-body MS-ring/collar protein FliF [Solicola sp. PLA-1-18]|uniref:flagellar basal-body MS-ring/collar protein FliF n=1 Tax=Solicola sp. PLA-1-18 TaxID=3380532 RepID=UPI003B7D1670
MKQQLMGRLAPLQQRFGALTGAQKAAVVGGLVVLLVAGVFFYRWVSTPSYSPLYTNISTEDASAVVEKLDADGTPYELTGGGTTIMVPNDLVYPTRIAMSGEGLPTQKSDGYSILDEQDLSTSQFQERTGYKRAMEGELAATIGGLDGVDTAVVHLAMPAEEVFADEQKPTTASVLVKTRAGETLSSEQVRAIVYLVSSSVEGLKPEDVTVADSTGKVLNSPGDEGGTGGGGDRAEVVQAYETKMSTALQKMLDRVVGPGNSSVQTTADLDFDNTVTDSTRYFANPDDLTLSETSSTENYDGAAADGAGGVVGPDGQLDTENATGTDGQGSTYRKTQRTADNALGKTVERRQAAPGNISKLHAAIVLDSQKVRPADAGVIEDMVVSALGIDTARGDTVEVNTMAFDRTAEKAAAKDLADAEAAATRGRYVEWGRNAAIVLAVIAVLGLWWRRRRRQHEERIEASTYVVEQLRQEALEREQQALTSAAPTTAIPLGGLPAGSGPSAATRDEIAALVERQPEEIAQLLRGWLVDTKP